MAVIYSRAEVLQYLWEEVGDITSSQTALEFDKSASFVNALDSTKTIILPMAEGQVAYELRFRGGSNNEVNVINVYAMRGDNDHYIPIAVFTITTGQQTDGALNFIDTISKSNDAWPDNGIEVISNGNDGVARAALNSYGYKNFLFIAVTLASLDLRMDAVRI